MRALAGAAAGAPLSTAWDACAFRGRWRPEQEQALAAAEGQDAVHLVLPPGAGKTLVGLELARRRRRNTLVLVPDEAVQEQWLRTWRQFGPADGGPSPVPASGQRSPGPLVVLPWSALAVWDRPGAPGADTAQADADRLAQRTSAVRGGGDLSLLHPAGRDLLERAARTGPWLVVLDDADALVEAWGALLPSVVRSLGRRTCVVALAGSPPDRLPARQRAVADALLGPVDLHVALPPAVRSGSTAPSQQLVAYCSPTAPEQAALEEHARRFSRLVDELLDGRAGSLPLPAWLRGRTQTRPLDATGAPLAWADAAAAEPELTRGALRLAAAGHLPVPPGARLSEADRVPPGADEWAAVLGAYALEHLEPSPVPADRELLREVAAVLPALGRRLTRTGLRSTASPVDAVLDRSPARGAATARLLGAELAVLGDDLRAVVVCDGDEDPAPGRGPTGARQALLALAAGDDAARLRPVLVTGRRVAAAPEVAQDLRRWCTRQGVVGLRSVPLAGLALYELVSDRSDWSPRTWAPLVADYLAAGGTRVLVGTRGLLGGGWDAPGVQVVVDLTTTASPVAVARVHGRGLHVDPARPDQVTDVWTVACVADGHPRGSVEHLRLARKHAAVLAPDAGGELVAGVRHLDPALQPWSPPEAAERAGVTQRALARAGARAEAWRAWHPSGGGTGEVVGLEVRVGQDLGLPGGALPASAARTTALLGTRSRLPGDAAPARLWPAPLMTAALCGGAGAAVGPLAGVVAGAGSGALVAGAVGVARFRAQLGALERVAPGATVGQLAAAVADALQAVGHTSRGADALAVTQRPDGRLRVELLGVPVTQSRALADAVEELLAPLTDPVLLVARQVVPVPQDDADRRRTARRQALGRPVDAALAWHAVPRALAAEGAPVEAFRAAWQARVGPPRLLRADEPEGREVLALLEGADPFEVRTSRLLRWA